jgi:NTE family protein
LKEKKCEENVLVLQGGGSLGAYECGVYKTIAKLKIKLDVVAGTSIGGINAAIIAAGKSGEPSKDLEDFWMTLAETVT